ncbi:hypothetical protein QRD02_03760 [Aequorivita sp. SDUM287046]|uniref:Uncharacterized protein n=1 Tax=Aequorivita aurantiaca TaxID=3053356 RepID=A0ABT8DKD0_9FLAO|nr:hypothetical protein [Aequorivita aurantiaca]MDN3723487.1 hypothetical protein [Aequorivita aurantiaca]
MKHLISFLLFFIALNTYSQDPYLQNSSWDVEQEAEKLTESYNEDLVLTTEQRLLFQQKVTEFLIRKHQIQASITGKEMLDELYKLKVQETAEMGDILTRPQLSLYKKIRPKIQPLETIDVKD